MKIIRYYEARQRFKSGTEIWACAFEYSGSKESKHLYQKPIKGKLTTHNTESYNNKAKESGKTAVNYFVPYKKNGKDLAWSKAVHISSRCYATSERECNELFNDLIQQQIAWHQKQIDELEKDLIEEV